MAETSKSLPASGVSLNAKGQTEGESIDGILDKAGPFRPLQVIIYLTVFYLELTVPLHNVLTIFTGHSPSWKCTEHRESTFCRDHQNETIHSEDIKYNERCKLNRSEWEYTTSRDHSFVTEYDLICDKTSTAAFISASFYIGSLFGAIMMGPLTDTFGRKKILVLCVIIVPFPSLIPINALWQFYPLEVIRGISFVGAGYIGYVYISELSPPVYRSLSMNIALLLSYLSFLLLDLLAFYIRSWRHLSICVGLLALPLWIALYYIPESPRWLLSKEKVELAEAILGDIIKYKGKLKPKLQVTNFNMTSKKKYSYLDLVRGRKRLQFTATITFIWTILPVLFYSISAQSVNLGGNMYVDYAYSSIADVPAFFLALLSNNCIGRKTTNLGGCFVSGLFLGGILLVPKVNKHRHVIVMILTFFARLFVSTSFYGIFLWTNELFPTVVRAQGMFLCCTFEKVGMILVPIITRILQGVSFNLPFILMCVGGALAALVGLSLPETKGKPTKENLEEMVSDSRGNVGIKHGSYNKGRENSGIVRD